MRPTTVMVRATLLLSVDVDAIREEQGDDSEMTDQEIAIEFVEGEGRAPIDNFILIEDVESAEVVAEREP